MTISSSIVWPALTKRPRAPMRATVARLIFERAVAGIPVRVTYPDGRVLGSGSPASPEFEVVRPAAFFARLGRDAKIGFGEAYTAGDWRAGPGTDLADLLTPFASRVTTLIPAPLQRLRVLVNRRVPAQPGEHPRRLASQYRRPLRPQQRPFRRVPGPHDELLVRLVRRQRADRGGHLA